MRQVLHVLFIICVAFCCSCASTATEPTTVLAPTREQVAPYGSWRSPVTVEVATSDGWSFKRPVVLSADGSEVYWVEVRPAEKGRAVLVRRRADGAVEDLIPPSHSVRTKVHEYGGGAFTVSGDLVVYSNGTDGRIYRRELESEEKPTPLTPPNKKLRYADMIVDRTRDRLIAVREDHRPEGREPVNALVSVDLKSGGEGELLASGHDFYSSPRLSPDGGRLAWLAWRHPNMPWDGTELWVARVQADGRLTEARRVAGGPTDSVMEPRWAPGGILHYISDRTGWWNLYRVSIRDGKSEHLAPMEAEFGTPAWTFGRISYGFTDAGEIICSYTKRGTWHLARLRRSDAAPRMKIEEVKTPYSEISRVGVSRQRVVFQGASPTLPRALVLLDLKKKTGSFSTIRTSLKLSIGPGYLSAGRQISFPTTDGATAHGIFYPPRNRDFRAPPGERPPLIVHAHGGPTGAVPHVLHPLVQYWTSRGFAFLIVNYRGSTGYGRAYRQQLKGRWGVVDVQDCENGARYLARTGEVDPKRMLIRGRSAGGYTTLCALTFGETFRAGASQFGLSDLVRFAQQTHKFESRYLDGLVAPLSTGKELLRARSPLYHVHRLKSPVILFQGLADKIVPPNQAELMITALRKRGVPVAYLAFEGEGHGFRDAKTIRRALEAELYFYGRVLGITPADQLEPVPISDLKGR